MATTNLVRNLPAFVFDLVCEILEEFEDLLKLAHVNTEIRGLVHDRRVLRPCFTWKSKALIFVLLG